MTKKLYRSEDKVLAGVLGGLGEYLDIDPVVLRLAFVFIAILTGVVPAIIAYIIACMIVPSKPRYTATEATYTEKPKEEKKEEKKDPLAQAGEVKSETV